MLFGFIAVLVVTTLLRLSLLDIALFSTLGIACGAFAHIVNEYTLLKDAPLTISLSEDRLRYTTKSGEYQVAFAKIEQLRQMEEAEYGLLIMTKDRKIMALSAGVGRKSVVGGAIHNAYVRWCVSQFGGLPESRASRLLKRSTLIVVSPPHKSS